MAVRSETMRSTLYKIAGGNPTLLVENCPAEKRADFVVRELGNVDQIGFITTGDTPTLTMMGDEMCVNATIAFARFKGGRGEMISSGFKGPVRFFNEGENTSIKFSMDYIIRDDFVLLPGIGFYTTQKDLVPFSADLDGYCSKFNLPAFGLLRYAANSIFPWIYVKQTKSLINESACGSGSIALNLLKGVTTVRQPTGQTIQVLRSGNQFTVTAKVVKMGAIK